MHTFLPQPLLDNIADRDPKFPKFGGDILRGHRAEITLDQLQGPGQNKVHIWDCKGTQQKRLGPASADDPLVPIIGGWMKQTLAVLDELFGRNGLNGYGGDVHINLHFGKQFVNAFWDGHDLVFGDGDGRVFGEFARSLDVVAHEAAHAIVGATSRLVYNGQPGALNEHFADVFGSTIQNSIGAHKPEWLIGDELFFRSVPGDSLRHMKFPGMAYDNGLMGKDQQRWHMNVYYDGWKDNGGVHLNSGIPNRVFALTAEEIGRYDAARLWYGALLRLGRQSTFKDWKIALIEQARIARHLHGAVQAIRWACKEVGI